MTDQKPIRLALIGARGYVGQELLQCLIAHDGLELVLASSSSQAGQPLTSVVPDWSGDQVFADLGPDQIGEVEADVWVLAVPNNQSQAWVAAIEPAHAEAIILDLGADYRFDENWTYGLTEFNRDALKTTRRIANPGCYATGAQFGLMPIREALAAPPVIFGVSGFSGAGRTPSPRNDPERLADNLIPYALGGHVHEREISTHLGRIVRFYPHVASFFRGISLTIAMRLTEAHTNQSLREMFQAAYENEPLIEISAEIPEIRELDPNAGLRIGGFNIDARDAQRGALVVVLDNLLKGAATQALQNLNLALGFDELSGVLNRSETAS
ncbi:MAG: N-acetyl-gamma-glutamyl-phosphate reductase [Pseudomonadota bacterium]